LTQGQAVPRFERIVADTVGATFGVAVNSATSALHIACLGLGLTEGDRLWTVPNTFVASANAGCYCGAEIDFVDIDPNTYLMDVNALEAKLTQAQTSGRLPKIVVPVHFAGQSCDMERIGALGRYFGFRVVEDASHAVGARYLDRMVGCCAYSDIVVFSFHPVKIVTTGEGGMCLTNDPDLADRMRLLRSHGITRDESAFARPSDGPWDYRQIMLGFNYRMTDFQAALGAAQFGHLDNFLKRRRAIAALYDTALTSLPVVRPKPRPNTHSSWHLYIVQVAAQVRRAVFEYMWSKGVGVQVLYIPVHRQPYYERLGFRAGDFPNSEQYYARSFTLPIFPTLTEREQKFVIETLADALARNGVAGTHA
jgi:UDP-4-amino-4,6-dideoxy-N-acetyl-beta-L-altrosamine transaminase